MLQPGASGLLPPRPKTLISDGVLLLGFRNSLKVLFLLSCANDEAAQREGLSCPRSLRPSGA